MFELWPSEQVEIRDLSARGQNGKNFIKQLVHDLSINTGLIRFQGEYLGYFRLSL